MNKPTLREAAQQADSYENEAWDAYDKALAEAQNPDEIKQIAEALRQAGLTLIRTGTGFRIADLGRVEAQTPPRPAKQPLTEEELGKIINANWGVGVWQMARAIERAHGIGEQE